MLFRSRRRVQQGRIQELERYLDTATRSAENAAALTQRLLAFARRQVLEPRPVDAGQLVQGMHELLRHSLGRKIRKEVRGTVASFTDSYQYTIDQLLEKIIERCRELNLRLTDSEASTKIDFMVFLTVQTMNYLHSGRHRVAL